MIIVEHTKQFALNSSRRKPPVRHDCCCFTPGNTPLDCPANAHALGCELRECLAFDQITPLHSSTCSTSLFRVEYMWR